MMKPALLNPDFRKLCYVFLIASCFLTTEIYTQPTPAISGDTAVCQGTEYFYSTEYVDGNSWTWSVSPGGVITQDLGNLIAVVWNGPQNSDQWLLVAETDPGMNEGTDQVEVIIASNILACENSVNISLDQNGFAEITPDMLLDGSYLTYDNFTVSLSLPNGTDLGNILDCSHIGQTIIGKVTDNCTGNSCWSNVKVEDKKSPVWECPDTAVVVPCYTDIDDYPHPPVYDNCDGDLLVSQVGLQVDNSDVCLGVTYIRHWVATDQFGNESNCTDTLFIDPDQPILFPDDRFWECSQYQQYPNITDPTPYTGVFSSTGSGVPIEGSGPYCPFSVSHSDDTISACGYTFKIIRTWTILNWCTNQIMTEDAFGNDNEQLIKIIDIQKPDLSVPTVELSITEPGNSSLTCKSKDLLPAPVFSDGCANVTIQIFTPVGEAIYVNGVDGKEGGFVPNPGLSLGNHAITYKATDDCGNVRELVVNGLVEDNTPPVTICDEITTVSLDQFGNTIVFAETFDDGSYDNCCVGEMVVKRMGEPDYNFAPSVGFTCDDEEVMVVMRVYDCFENYNECMVTVLVEDKMAPSCIPPQNKTIPCTQLPPDITPDFVEGFGEALAFDNCNADIIELPYAININSCGEGHIIRFFSAIDDSGNISGNCEQHIYVTPVSDWLIHFPQNWEGTCGDSIAAPEIEIGGFACEQLAMSHEDQFFALSNDSACYKIVRTWKVINWCTYDPNEDPIIVPHDSIAVLVDETTYNNFGSYEYQQIIKVKDNTPPVLSAPFVYEFCSEDNCLSGDVYLPINIEGECSSDFEIAYHIDLDNNGSFDLQGTGFFENSMAVGVHRILYLVMDGCANESEIEFTFEIRDCKKPTAVCKNGLIVEIMQTGMIEVCASALNDYSFDNCPGDLLFSYSNDPADSCQVFNCLHVDSQTPLTIWVTDAAGNQDYCDTYIIIQDNMLACQSGVPASGLIATQSDDPVQDVTVQLNGSTGNQSYLTTNSGVYLFDDLEIGEDYSITPAKDDAPLNGVTTFDLVLISRHILGIQSLDTPYKLIAADVNNSSSVTTFDLVELRKLILFINNEFPNNTSWRFVDKDFSFPNPANPWETVFPELINLNNLGTAILDADFVAVKIGDVNGSALSNDDNFGNNNSSERGNGMLMFEIEDEWLEAGMTVPVTFRAKDFQDVYGFQFTIDFDVSALDFQSVTSTILTDDENYGLSLTGQGAITALWYETNMTTLEDHEPVLQLEFLVKSDCNVHDVIGISSRFTTAEAYVGSDMDIWNVDVDFNNSVTAADDVLMEGFILHQNIPNPFSERTTIGFELPASGQASITVYDRAGRTVKTFEGQYQSGYNEVSIDRTDLPVNGTLFYKLEADGRTAVKQMTLVGN